MCWNLIGELNIQYLNFVIPTTSFTRFFEKYGQLFWELIEGMKGDQRDPRPMSNKRIFKVQSNRFEQHPSIALQGQLNKVWDLDDDFKWFFHKIFKYQLNKIYLHIYIYIYYICLKTHLFTFWNAKLLIKLIHLGFVNIFFTIELIHFIYTLITIPFRWNNLGFQMGWIFIGLVFLRSSWSWEK